MSSVQIWKRCDRLHGGKRGGGGAGAALATVHCLSLCNIGLSLGYDPCLVSMGEVTLIKTCWKTGDYLYFLLIVHPWVSDAEVTQYDIHKITQLNFPYHQNNLSDFATRKPLFETVALLV